MVTFRTVHFMHLPRCARLLFQVLVGSLAKVRET